MSQDINYSPTHFWFRQLGDDFVVIFIITSQGGKEGGKEVFLLRVSRIANTVQNNEEEFFLKVKIMIPLKDLSILCIISQFFTIKYLKLKYVVFPRCVELKHCWFYS